MLAAYGVWQDKVLYGVKKKGVVRTTYLLGADGTVLQVFPRVRVEGHIQEVLAALKSFRG